jgi:hypothetical protein
MYFTLRPAEWAEWCEDRLFGAGGVNVDPAWMYEELRHRALNDPPEKAVDALERLKGG